MKALKPASSKPTPNPETTDKSKLQATIDQAKALDLSGYTKKSAQAVRDALAKAQSVLADDNATQLTSTPRRRPSPTRSPHWRRPMPTATPSPRRVRTSPSSAWPA